MFYENEEFRILTFYLNDKLFAIPILEIKEIHRISTLKILEKAPPEILGVINFHSSVIPVFNLKLLLGMKPVANQENVCIAIKNKESYVSLSVDKLHIFIKQRPYLVWYVKHPEKLSEESIVEAVLNYGDFEDVKEMISILGIKKTAQIFKQQTQSKKRCNYHPKTKNYFQLYFNKYA